MKTLAKTGKNVDETVKMIPIAMLAQTNPADVCCSLCNQLLRKFCK